MASAEKSFLELIVGRQQKFMDYLYNPENLGGTKLCNIVRCQDKQTVNLFTDIMLPLRHSPEDVLMNAVIFRGSFNDLEIFMSVCSPTSKLPTTKSMTREETMRCQERYENQPTGRKRNSAYLGMRSPKLRDFARLASICAEAWVAIRQRSCKNSKKNGHTSIKNG
eukprot:SAG31_NODE_652_length_13181_cov_14.268155_11_plen_166_part_00